MMNDIATYIRKNGMLLFNESFSSTNTREGSEIAMQITNALLENAIPHISVSTIGMIFLTLFLVVMAVLVSVIFEYLAITVHLCENHLFRLVHIHYYMLNIRI